MTQARCRDINWVVNTRIGNKGQHLPQTHEDAMLALQMDLRDELKVQNALLERLVRVLECRNALDIPYILRRIDKRIAKHLPLIDKPVNNG